MWSLLSTLSPAGPGLVGTEIRSSGSLVITWREESSKDQDREDLARAGREPREKME